MRDTTIFDLIAQENQRQIKGIELIASENFCITAGYGGPGLCIDQ